MIRPVLSLKRLFFDEAGGKVRYCGLCSNAHRGKMRKAGCDPLYPPIIEDDPIYVPSKGWAERSLAKTWCLVAGGDLFSFFCP
jgi:hypothetical protein